MALTSTVIFSAPQVSAHRSGCHRWHSCPTDSGSYTCGDTGYTSGCGGSTYTAPAPLVNYAHQGYTNGTSNAERDTSSIEAFARISGTTSGTTDGSLGTYRSPSPKSDLTCAKTFTYDTAQDTLYVSSYKTAYEVRCSELFSAAFKLTYASAYNSAETLRVQAEEKKKAGQNVIFLWIIGGGVAIWIIWAIVSSYKNN